MEGGTTVGETSGDMEGYFHVKRTRRWWGLRPWKRHSLILMVSGILYVFVGVQYIIAEPRRSREVALEVILQVAPLHIWGGVFVFAGILAMISSRWPPLAETWGYTVLTGMSAGWSTTYLMGMIFRDAPSMNVTQVFLWGTLAFMWWGISGLVNPDHTSVASDDRG